VYWDYGGMTYGQSRVTTSYTSWTYVTLVSTGSGATFQGIDLTGALVASDANSTSSTVTGDLIVGGHPWASQTGPPY
jgi:hypothetical protein